MRKVKEPKFKRGDTVICDLVRPGLLTISEDPVWNGSMWRYSFEGSDASCGELFISFAPTTLTNTTQDDNKWRVGQWFNGSAIIESEKQVLCRVFRHDFITDEEADMYAKALVRGINEYPKLIEVVKELNEILGAVKNELDEWNGLGNYSTLLKQIENALSKSKEILP